MSRSNGGVRKPEIAKESFDCFATPAADSCAMTLCATPSEVPRKAASSARLLMASPTPCLRRTASRGEIMAAARSALVLRGDRLARTRSATPTPASTSSSTRYSRCLARCAQAMMAFTRAASESNPALLTSCTHPVSSSDGRRLVTSSDAVRWRLTVSCVRCGGRRRTRPAYRFTSKLWPGRSTSPPCRPSRWAARDYGVARVKRFTRSGLAAVAKSVQGRPLSMAGFRGRGRSSTDRRMAQSSLEEAYLPSSRGRAKQDACFRLYMPWKNSRRLS